VFPAGRFRSFKKIFQAHSDLPIVSHSRMEMEPVLPFSFGGPGWAAPRSFDNIDSREHEDGRVPSFIVPGRTLLVGADN
jgi:hypothetical protein